jgi:ABC-2 type transport system ATP-binding protein
MIRRLGLDGREEQIAGLPGVESVAPFGAALHVSGPDRATLQAAIAPYRREPFRWTDVEPTLEDVFIHLMGQAQDNFQ